jgi:PAS domain S-box-containing protein
MAYPDVKHQPTFEDLELLAEVSKLLTLLDLDRVLKEVIHLMRTSVGATKASLLVRDELDLDWQRVILSRDLTPDETFDVVQRVLDEGLAGWVVRHRQGTIVQDTETDERWHVFPDDTNPVRSALCVPFMHDDHVVVVLTLVHPEPGHFDNRQLRMMTIVANHATVAIRNAQLFNRVQSQQRQLEAVLLSIPDVLMVLDDRGKILLINPAAGMLLGGIEQQEAIGKLVADFAQTDRGLAPIQEIIDNPLQSGTYWSFEARSERHKLDFIVTVSMWEDAARGMAGYVVVMHDITTSRDLHRFKDEMLKVASHDLRSPLSLIGGYCDLLNMDIPASETNLHDYLDVIARSVERMNGLLDDMLRVEQVRSSPLELREPLDLNELINTVMSNMRPLASQKNQILTDHVPPEKLPIVVADKVQIREAMDNLIGNAIKYTPSGGHIMVSAYVEDNRFFFMVEDTGLGIPEEHLSRIFDSYYRAKQDGAEGIEGTGLGLSLVKTVAERHAGDVWVHSQPGVGSQFGFWLPL